MTFREHAERLLKDVSEQERHVALELATRVSSDGVDAFYTALDFLQFLRGEVPVDMGTCPQCGFPEGSADEPEVELDPTVVSVTSTRRH